MQNAPMSRPEKPLVLVIVKCNSALPVAAKQMRRIFGPCGGSARQDVLVAADVDVEEAGYGAWVARKGEEGEGEEWERR